LNLSYSDEELAPMPGKQRKEFDARFKSSFDAEFQKRSALWMKRIQEAIADTESRIAGKAEKEMKEAVATANQLLRQAFETWQADMAKLCEACVVSAYEASVAKMQRKLVKAKIKAACKIVLIAGLALTAAALTIAASVVSGGALAPLVVGAIVTGAGALYKAYQVYDKNWASAANKIKEIEADIQRLKSAVQTYKKTETSYSGALQRAQAFKATLSTPVADIEKHVGQLDKYIFEMQSTIKAQKTKLDELAREAGSEKVNAAVRKCVAQLEKASDQLKAIADCKAAAAEMKAAYAAQKLPDYGKLNSVVAAWNGASTVVSQVGTSVKTCLDLLKKLGVAVPV
jgi:hypothetical protein